MEQYKENYANLDENTIDIIKSKGYCVIPNVLDKNEINNAKTGLWNTLEYLTQHLPSPIKRDDSKTWNTYYELHSNRKLIIQNWKIGHSQFVWDIRQNPKVANIFSTIWNVEKTDLLTSFDAVSFHIPPEITGKGFFDGNSWWHTDQAPNNKSFTCIQGMVLLYDVNPGDATLRVLENSNQFHKSFFEENNIDKDSNWYMFNKKELKYFTNKGCVPINVLAKAGDVILWDSRTIHFGMPPLKERLVPNLRANIYVCMTPRYLIDKFNLEKKQKGFNNMEMTSHWPHKIKFFKKYTRNYDIIPNIPDIPKPKLTELGYKLAGF